MWYAFGLAASREFFDQPW